MGAIVNNLLDRASEAYASLEALLINEIAAGNVIASTPMAACGRVVLGVACAVTRSYLGQMVSDGTAQDRYSLR